VPSAPTVVDRVNAVHIIQSDQHGPHFVTLPRDYQHFAGSSFREEDKPGSLKSRFPGLTDSRLSREHSIDSIRYVAGHLSKNTANNHHKVYRRRVSVSRRTTRGDGNEGKDKRMREGHSANKAAIDRRRVGHSQGKGEIRVNDRTGI